MRCWVQWRRDDIRFCCANEKMRSSNERMASATIQTTIKSAGSETIVDLARTRWTAAPSKLVVLCRDTIQSSPVTLRSHLGRCTANLVSTCRAHEYPIKFLAPRHDQYFMHTFRCSSVLNSVKLLPPSGSRRSEMSRRVASFMARYPPTHAILFALVMCICHAL